MENNTKKSSTQETMVKGSAWMTFGSIFSRILGAIYIIPWYAWMGSHGNIANALTAKSYNVYSLFIIVSTAGIPGAIAKQVAKYNALNEYGIGRQLYRRGLILMAIFGIACAALMYFAAPVLAADDILGAIFHGENSDPAQVAVMRSLSYALLLIPILSIMRGYFQGYADMMPPAMSQLVEQVARVGWMLLTAFLIMQIQHGSYVTAVVQSNLAAAIGAVFGILLLLWFLYRRKNTLDALIENSNNAIKISTLEIFKEIINQSIPFIIIDSGITLFQLVDQYTFPSMIRMFVHATQSQVDTWYALFGLNANKLIMIIISLATAMAVTAIPLLSGAHAQKDYRSIANQVENILELFFFVMMPAALGMAAISIPMYTIFYGFDLLGSRILYISAFTAISLGAFTVLMAILQGLSENGLAIKYLILGLIIKLAIQLPMIKFFKVFGPLFATNIGMLVIIWLALQHLKVRYQYNSSRTWRRFVGITAFSLIMFICVSIIVSIGSKFINPAGRMGALVLVVVAAGIGVIIYGYLTLKTSLAQKILGHKVDAILRKLHIKI